MRKKRTKPKRLPIEAAGGIVMRGGVRPLFAVVRLRRQKSWVLPKGKLNRDETAIAAARREVIEETGHDVEVHEFLGSLVYQSAGGSKTVKFWRMEASPQPVAKLMHDVRAVRWLPLAQAIAKLTHEREKLFLDQVGRQLVRQTGPSMRRSPLAAKKAASARGGKPKAARKRVTVDTTAPASRTAAAGLPAFHIQTASRKPPAAVRKLWALLRR